jgi:hypothetical protein
MNFNKNLNSVTLEQRLDLVDFSFTHGGGCEKEFAMKRDVHKKVNNLKTNRYRKKETSMNDRGAFLCDAAESSFLI